MHDARDLSRRIASLLAEERNSLAEFLLALADFDRQRGWAALGYATLFQYLERELRLTSSAAARRMTAARLVQRFPAVVEPLRNGRICMSVVYELAKALTPENVGEVLPQFFGLSKREAEALVAKLKPVANPPRREVVTAVARAAPPAAEAPCTAPLPEGTSPAKSERVQPADAGDLFPSPARSPSAPGRPRDEVEPLDAELRRFHVTVSKAFLAKLGAAKDALSHTIPDGDSEAVLSAALDLLLEKAAKRRGLVKSPRSTSPAPSSDPRHIPSAVEREVWKRDGGRCAFTLPDGAVCGSTTRLQLDHIIAVALGGRSDPPNLRIACERHNQLAVAGRSETAGWIGSRARGPRTLSGARARTRPAISNGANRMPHPPVIQHDARMAHDLKPRPRSAVSNILRQTLRDLRLVIVDDGSTDGTADILARLAEREPRLEVVRGPGEGIALALQRGLARCDAEVVAGMDADDLAHPRHLELRVAALDAQPAPWTSSRRLLRYDAPGLVGIEALHPLERIESRRAEVLLVDQTVVTHHEGL